MDKNINYLMEQGQSLYASGNKADAIRYFEKAAQMGDENAQMITAICYFNGDGVTKSLEKATSILRGLAEKGECRCRIPFRRMLCRDKCNAGTDMV